MPMNRRDYPADWPQISAEVRERAGNRCEWCGVPNGERIVREPDGTWHTLRWLVDNNRDLLAWDADMLAAECFITEDQRVTTIVLTVAHLGAPRADGSRGDKHDKHDCRPENLAALCQSCHLGFDRDDHIQRQRRNRWLRARAQRVALGQQEIML